MKRPLLAVLAVLALQGCAGSAVPLQSAWYLQTGSDDRAQVQIALLNRSVRALEVTEVLLNPGDADGSTGAVWSHAENFSLPPGRLVLLQADQFKRGDRSFHQNCLIPVSISVRVTPATLTWLQETYGRVHGEKRGYIPVDLIGRMPSSLPDAWQACGPS